MKSHTEDSKERWQAKWLSSPVFNDLDIIFTLTRYQTWPSLEQLSALNALHGECSVTFVDSEQFATEPLYYEEIVAHRNFVPTRKNNWHDLFNALIWRLFPLTKKRLNAQHMQDIQRHGVRPRTPRRDRITHFDECGVVLALSEPQIGHYLHEHQWQKGFVDQRLDWGRVVRPFIFGHANYEMMLNPFVGLTGKWMGVEVSPAFFELPMAEQYQQLDLKLQQKMQNEDPFSVKGALAPLPLLGIPGWYQPNENAVFYSNEDYFRPKPQSARSSLKRVEQF